MEENLTQIGVGQVANKTNRVIFVEPNDVFDKDNENIGTHNDLSLTPNYSDFSVSFNLIIESYQRLKAGTVSKINTGNVEVNDKKSSEKKTMSIQWNLTSEQMFKNRQSTLSGGLKDGLQNYITTYYTDLNYGTYKEKTEIEGLGVESVQISYESWYTPTIVIKFVDVRGSSLFGREDAIHVNEDLIAENVFGAFFTLPYPLFRLQVKGFLGKPVTYQLTCSNFKGNFNSQNGNFEATVTFIGYSWSLLTDIPFSYLIAAPYSPYLGSEYWEKMVNSKSWALWNGNHGETLPPCKLKVLFDKIKEQIPSDNTDGNDTDTFANDDESKILQDSVNEINILQDLTNNLTEFINGLKEACENNYIETEDNDTNTYQLIMFSDEENIKLNTDQTKKNNDFLIKYDEYINSFKDDKINLSNKPTFPSIFKLKDYFIVTRTDNDNIKAIRLNNSSANVEQSLNDVLINKQKLTKPSKKEILRQINELTDVKIKQYVYLISIPNFFNIIEDKIRFLNIRQEEIHDNIQNRINYDILQFLPFKPFIGNLFKVIFCHLETFCYIMYQSAQEIYDQAQNGKRSREYLGISDNNVQTDTIDNAIEYVTPWPAIFNSKIKDNDENNIGYQNDDELSTVYGWVGDVNHKFIEERVVYSIQEGIQLLADEKANEENKNNGIIGIPILPSDFLHKNYSFFGLNNITISELSGYLAMRGYSIISILCGNNITSDLCKQLGRFEAYNFYQAFPDTTKLKIILDNINKEDIDLLKGIALCDPKYDSYGVEIQSGSGVYRHKFETAKKVVFNKQGRHPMLYKHDNTLYFSHWYDKKYNIFLPSELKDFNSYNNINFVKNDGETTYFEFVNTEDEDTNYFPNILTINLTKFDNYKENLYNIDDSLFKIIKYEDQIGVKINDKLDEIWEGKFNFRDYEVTEDSEELRDKFYKITNGDRVKFYGDIDNFLTVDSFYKELDKDSHNFLPTDNLFNEKFSDNLNFTTNKWFNDYDINAKNIVKVKYNTDSYEFESNLDSEDDYEDFRVKTLTYLDDGCFVSIFGSLLYYIQNERHPKIKETDSEYLERRLCSKALLFLHCYRFQYSKCKLNFLDEDKTNGVIENVPKGLLLLLGGLLWRYKWAKQHNNIDPLIKHGSGLSDDLTYVLPDVNTSLIFNNNLYGDIFYATTNKNYKPDYLSIEDIFGQEPSKIKYRSDALIKFFKNFVKERFSSISSNYELKNITYNTNNEKNFVDYTGLSFYEDLTELKKIIKKNNSESFGRFIRNMGFGGWFGKYLSINLNSYETGLLLLFNNKDIDTQKIFRKLYTSFYLVLDSCFTNKSTVEIDSYLNIDENLFDSYLTGFKDGLNNVLKKTINYNSNPQEGEYFVPDKLKKNRDLSISVYYYLKNLWDKWLVSQDFSNYTVENFFKKDFVFIDSFYRNVYHRLAINCQILLDTWDGMGKESSIFSFLSEIIRQHNCIFLPVPDYIGFKGGGLKDDQETMNNLFRPMPYNAISDPNTNNKFIVMYTQPYSSRVTQDNGYKLDSFDIWSNGKFTDDAKKLFSSTNESDVDKDDEIATLYGYNVPSFGVSFAKQNNHIFENLNVGMDNPVMTEQSIKTQFEIAQRGNGDERRICFIGQDTFNVFSNYSYSVDIQMLGNAQICPLMYFQLTNIPMWRGTYMIYKVVHNMTPGNMTTTFTGMKMSKYIKPFNTSFFIYRIQNNDTLLGDGLHDNCDGDSYDGGEFSGNYGSAGMFTDKSSEEKLKMCHIPNPKTFGAQDAINNNLIKEIEIPTSKNGMQKIKVNKYIAADLIQICKEIMEQMPEFDLLVTSAFRTSNSLKKSNKISRHCVGLAIDINGGNRGNPYFKVGVPKDQKEPNNGDPKPWDVRQSNYDGNYDRNKCIWHWNHPVVQIFLKHGWGWGGSYGDVMHFSIDGN